MPSSCSSSLHVIEVARRQDKVRESSGNVGNLSKYEVAQARLQELKSNMIVLENQLIKTNQVNILTRSLLLKQKQKSGTTSQNRKGADTNEGSRKRDPERTVDGRSPAKRATSTTQNGSRQDAENMLKRAAEAVAAKFRDSKTTYMLETAYRKHKSPSVENANKTQVSLFLATSGLSVKSPAPCAEYIPDILKLEIPENL
ncbi:unnamed protein product [Lactuca saligna]|uniref:Uncharacterized protein n=1 Tax=Lactuca saligna TaxID=75948 RepID=A0AA35YCY9_LACSI|nr:unnamed protein product [Lactuca saligna]